MFPSPCGSIPGTPSICACPSTAVTSPISWFPAVFVKPPASTLMLPLKNPLRFARNEYPYANPPVPTALFALIAVA
jgi:hypothetical protein